MMLGSSIYVKINSKMIAILLHFDYYHEVCTVHLSHVAAWNLHHESFSIIYFFFHPPTYRETTMATTIRARIYTRGEVSFAKFLFLPS
jgi:hypothetical protein